ncbi:MAG: response regulator transcription factor [Caldilineales bacterium]|nr:response regulator transcription factor [Caldilineales bacterium]
MPTAIDTVPANPIRVMIVDDHASVRNTIAIALNAQEDMHLVGQAVNGREAVLLSGRIHPHVILMDVEMPEMDGITAIALIRRFQPQVQIIALTARLDSRPIHAAQRAGAYTILPKVVPYAKVIEEIRAAHASATTTWTRHE